MNKSLLNTLTQQKNIGRLDTTKLTTLGKNEICQTNNIDDILSITYCGLEWLQDNYDPNMGTTLENAFAGINPLKNLILQLLTNNK